MPQRPAPRRHQARAPSRAGDTVADRCRHLACSTRWRDTWRSRADATQATWAQERSTRPTSHPTHTPEHVAQAVVARHQTVRHHGTGRAAALLQALGQHGRAPLPSPRPLDRMRRRYDPEGNAHGSRASTPG